MQHETEPKEGSARHAREVADFLRANGDGDGAHLSPTDAEMAERALRSYAGRHLRHAGTVALACVAVGATVFGTRADLSNYVAAARGTASQSIVATPRNLPKGGELARRVLPPSGKKKG